MKRRKFLGNLAVLPVIAALPSTVNSIEFANQAKPSSWLRALESNRDFDSLHFWATSQMTSKVPVVDLAGAMLWIGAIDQMLAELSGNVSIKLFPRSPWQGCHILSVSFHLSSYMMMRYELTADKNNAELDRAHEGAIWSLDARIPDDVVLFEAVNGHLGLVRRAYNTQRR